MCSTFDNQSEQDERMLHDSRATNQPHEQTRTNLFNEPKVTSQPLTTEDESAERKSEYYWLLKKNINVFRIIDMIHCISASL